MRTETANCEGREVNSSVFLYAPCVEGREGREDNDANDGGNQRGRVAVGFELHGTCFGVYSDSSAVHDQPEGMGFNKG